MSSRLTIQGLARLFLLVALYTLSFVAMTYPLARQADSAFVCAPADGPSDAYVFLWNIDHFVRSVHAGGPYLWTDRVVHPVGVNLLFHTYCPLYGLAGLLIGDPVRTLNAVVFLSFLASGLGAYALCRLFCRSRALCAAAGFAYAFWPYKLTRLEGHYNLVLTGAMPFFVWFVVRGIAYDEERKRPAAANVPCLLGAAACLALTALSDHYYTFYLLLFTGLYAFRAPLLRSRPARAAARRPAAAVALCVAVPTLAVLLRKALHLEIAMHGEMALTLDLLGVLLPPRNGLLFRGNAPEEWYHPLGLVYIRGFFMGYAVLIPALLYLWKRRYREAPPALQGLVLATGGFALLALPVVRVHHVPLIALPSVFFYWVPGLGNFREAARASSMLMLFLPLFAAVQIEAWMRGTARYTRRWVGAAWLLVLAAEYYQSPLPVVPLRNVPAVYQRLASRDDGVLLEVPFWVSCGFWGIGDVQTWQQYYQTIHHKELVSGHASRIPPKVRDWFLADAVLRELVRLEANPQLRPQAAAADDVDACIRRCHIRYVLVPRERRSSAAGRFAEESFGPRAARREEIEGALLLSLR